MVTKADILAELRKDIAELEQTKNSSLHGGVSVSHFSGHQDDGCQNNEDSSGSFHNASSISQDPFDSPADEVYQKILRLVSVRERSSLYLHDRLVKDGFDEQAIEAALDRANRVGAVDDRRYSDSLIRMKLSAGKGLRYAEREIQSLGIDPHSLDAWREHHALGRDAEVQRAVTLLRRRPPRAKRAREAAFRRLVTQGYEVDVASRAARLWYENHYEAN